MPPFLDDPENLRLLGALVVALGLVVGGKKVLGSSGKPKRPANLDKLLKEGRYMEAADQAMKADRPAEAIEYYLRAQQPARAAHVAVKLGNAKMAAELFERAGSYTNAALWYEKAQNPTKADEMRRKATPEARQPAELPPLPAPSAQSKGPSVAEIELKRKSRELAEVHLQAGNIKSAADAYRDADMFDEAIHLYVNVLAMPGEAASLIKKRGNVERAADLYELAGMKEEAATTLAEGGLRGKTPEQYVDRIAKLSTKVALDYTTQLVRSRPVNAANRELHYAYGRLLEEAGKRDQALETFTGLRSTGAYKDVGDRIDALRAPPKPAAPMAPPMRAPSMGGGLLFGGPIQGQAPFPPGVSPTPAPMVVYRGVTDEEVARIAREAASAAVSAARRANPGQLEITHFKNAAEPTHIPNAAVPDTFLKGNRAGLGNEPLPPSLLDGDVIAARLGPTTESLRDALQGDPVTEANVELHYRLGLAYLAEGNWSQALEAFEKVEGTIPGYRGAGKRANEIKKWRDALTPSLTSIGVEGQAKKAPGRYTLKGELGRGGMAVVYRATDTVLGRDVALKFLSDALSARDDVRELFQREARAVAALNHPNIVTVYDFGTLEGRTFIAMEFVEGTTVKDMMTERIPVAEALRILKQLLEALDLAHGRKIIHRDIKPSNVMVTNTGLIKLMDFGLAKSIASGAEASMVAGTPAYMSPEQMVGQDVDHRTDLFAVGVMAYQMLSGQLPFVGMDRTRIPVSLRSVTPNVPEALDLLITTSLAFDRSLRVQNAQEFLEPVRFLLTRVQEASFR